MKRKLILCCFPILLPGYLQAQKIESGTPKEVGMSGERLERIDNYLEESIEARKIPGAVALIARNGKVVYHKAFGTSNAKGEELEIDDIFRIASMTKAITSTAVMMLWEEGKFKLDDPISKWISEFKDPGILDSLYADGSYTTIPANQEITVRHLITHTSGLGYGEIDSDPRFKRIYNEAGVTELFTKEEIYIQEVAKKIGQLPIHHEPGASFTYSTGLDVLGAFIEIVSGMPLDEFFQTRIFDPLEMNDSQFYLPKSEASRLVEVQTKAEDEFVRFEADFYEVDFPIKGAKTFFSGGAGLTSTALDYSKFLQMYLNNGVYNGDRILSRKTVELIMSNQVDEMWPNDGKHYGLAFDVVDELGAKWLGAKSIGTFSWGGYFNTSYFADPQEQLIGIIMKQTWDIGWDETTAIYQQLVYQAIDD